jgi:hypothetical protein
LFNCHGATVLITEETHHKGLTVLAMRVGSDDQILAAEMLAVKTVMAHVLGRINQLDPILAQAIQRGFEDAADSIRKTAARSRKRAAADQAAKAIAVVEAVRAATKKYDRIRISVANEHT